MKREILCRSCCSEFILSIGAVGSGPSFASATKYPGEFVRVIEGRSMSTFVCDLCGVGLNVGEAAAALSIYTERTPYSEWESTFIKSDVPVDPNDPSMTLEFEAEDWPENQSQSKAGRN